METLGKEFVFLENVSQAKEYLSSSEYKKDSVIVSFDFNVEFLLKSSGLTFLREEDYEDEGTYSGVYRNAKQILDLLFKKYSFEYREINLLSLFYYDLCVFLSQIKKMEIILKKIIEKEKPGSIMIYHSEGHSGIIGESINHLIRDLFKGKINIRSYELVRGKNVRDKKIVKLMGKWQNKYAKFSLSSKDQKKRKIFVYGGKIYFSSIVNTLLKNSKNKVINFDGILKKSFFSRGRLLPFYEFTGVNSISTTDIESRLEKFLDKVNEEKFFNEITGDPILCNVLRVEIRSIIKGKFRKIISQIEEMFNVFEKNSVKILLLSEDHSPFAKASIRVAKQLKIPTVVFLHGLPVRDMNFGPFEPDLFLVYGEKIKEKYLENTPKSETKIEVIGCPRYDNFSKSEFSDSDIVLYPLDCAGEAKIIPDRNITKKKQRESLKIVFRTLKKFPEYRLIMKLKPNWDMAEIINLVAKEEEFYNFEVVDKTDNLKLMKNSKFLIINHTTMGLESMLIGKKVISISFRDLDDYTPYTKIDAVKKVYNEKELEREISNIDKSELNEFSQAILADGNATQRAVDIITNLINLENINKNP